MARDISLEKTSASTAGYIYKVIQLAQFEFLKTHLIGLPAGYMRWLKPELSLVLNVDGLYV